MPYTETTPTLLLCQALVDLLVTNWVPVAPNGCEWDYFKRINDEGARKLEGRQVYIFPTDYSFVGENRKEDAYEHRITVLTVERYTDAGDPLRDWVSERVDFVYQQIALGFDFDNTGPPSWNRKLLTLSSEIEVVNLDRLITEKLFHSAVELVFSELIDA